MENLNTKKIIALTLVGAYVCVTCYGMVTNKNIPDGFVGMVSMVLGYYFGKGAILNNINNK
jgi:hypothetical protein